MRIPGEGSFAPWQHLLRKSCADALAGREMEERIRMVVFRAVEIGKESGTRVLTREEFRWKKQVGELKAQVRSLQHA